MLELDFYYRSPIDFEYKNYLLLGYLSEIDKSFAIHQLSPFLLHTEKIINELNKFTNNVALFKNSLKKEVVGISLKTGIIYNKTEEPEKLKDIIEIVEYSKPLLQGKLDLGYKLYAKFPQLLY